MYVQAQGMFDNGTYLKLLSVVDSGIKQAKVDNSNFEVEYVSACISSDIIVMPQNPQALWTEPSNNLLVDKINSSKNTQNWI